jgi:hypothetical protein
MLQCSQPPVMPCWPYVQDGFPQQRGWSDRVLESVDFRAVRIRFPLGHRSWRQELRRKI